VPSLTELWTITPRGVLAVVLATVVMYVVFLVLVRAMRRRSLVAMSPYDIACIAALGAVLGRTSLLSVPTLTGGIVTMVTLFAQQRLLGFAQNTPRLGVLLRHEPILLMAGPDIRHDGLLSARVTLDELRQCLRLAGITRLSEVAWVGSGGQWPDQRGPPGLHAGPVPGRRRARVRRSEVSINAHSSRKCAAQGPADQKMVVAPESAGSGVPDPGRAGNITGSPAVGQ